MRETLRHRLDAALTKATQQLGGVCLIIGVLWVFFFLRWITWGGINEWLALRPRQLWGLHGILTMPLVHGSFPHLLSNTIPLIVMLLILVVMKPQIWREIALSIVVVSGSLIWLLGPRDSIICGASGLVMGLVTFLIAPGAIILSWWAFMTFTGRKIPIPIHVRPVPMVVSALVGFFYLDNLVFNLIPIFPTVKDVSYESHWFGAIGGLIVAIYVSRKVDSVAEQSATDELLKEMVS